VQEISRTLFGVEGTFDVPMSLERERGPMTEYALDDVDRQLLGLLEEDARYTAIDLAEAIGISDNTVHNRMARMEEAGVIRGYTTLVDHDRIGLPLSFVFSCTAQISERSELAAQILEIPEVVEVTELMTGRENVLVKAVGAEDEDITRVAEAVDELGIEIDDENLIRSEDTRALDYVEIDGRLNDGA
jgi:DNA-binding Lrp family transcriptional regulator